MNDTKCVDCGASGKGILVAVFDGCGPFDPPSGYACYDCRPREFDRFSGVGR